MSAQLGDGLVDFRVATEMSDKLHSGRPCTATTLENKVRLDQLILADLWITVNEMHVELDVGASTLETMLSSLGYSKVCARWAPRMLTQDQKDHRQSVYQDLLDRYEAEGDGRILGQQHH